MKTTKFINKDMAVIAATTVYIAAVRKGYYVNLRGGGETGWFTIDVHLEIDEQFTLPSGYLYSGVEEKTYNSPMQECPPFKSKSYYFEF